MGGIIRRRELLAGMGHFEPVTYDLSVEIPNPSRIHIGDTLLAPFRASAYEIQLPKGNYKFELWAANGGGSYGGAGGYSIGSWHTNSQKAIYLYTGKTGGTGVGVRAFPDGGAATASGSNYSYGGGGSTSVRIGQDSLYSRLIVAGAGGGGYSSANAGGAGGGTSGGQGTCTTTSARAGGGTQTAGGAGGAATNPGDAGTFGQGGNARQTSSGTYRSGGGGGGWYGGGGGGTQSSSGGQSGGGGGSGYVYTAATAVNYPAGCLLTSADYLTDAATYQGGSIPAGSEKPVAGNNGYIRITVL